MHLQVTGCIFSNRKNRNSKFKLLIVCYTQQIKMYLFYSRLCCLLIKTVGLILSILRSEGRAGLSIGNLLN